MVYFGPESYALEAVFQKGLEDYDFVVDVTILIANPLGEALQMDFNATVRLDKIR